MIVNFRKRMDNEILTIPVWYAGSQKYKVLSVHESAHGMDWEGQIVTKHIPSPFSVPKDIDVRIRKTYSQMEWMVDVVHTDEMGTDTTIRSVMVLPIHLKSPATFGKLIADIINRPAIDYFN